MNHTVDIRGVDKVRLLHVLWQGGDLLAPIYSAKWDEADARKAVKHYIDQFHGEYIGYDLSGDTVHCDKCSEYRRFEKIVQLVRSFVQYDTLVVPNSEFHWRFEINFNEQPSVEFMNHKDRGKSNAVCMWTIDGIDHYCVRCTSVDDIVIGFECPMCFVVPHRGAIHRYSSGGNRAIGFHGTQEACCPDGTFNDTGKPFALFVTQNTKGYVK